MRNSLDPMWYFLQSLVIFSGALDDIRSCSSQCFCLQDKLLDSYMNTGDFTKENDLPAYRSHPMPRRPYSLINMLLWVAFVLSQILRFYYNLIVSGSLLSLSFAVGIVICGKFLDYNYCIISGWGKWGHWLCVLLALQDSEGLSSKSHWTGLWLDRRVVEWRSWGSSQG